MAPTTKKLDRLRELMREHDLDFYIVPSEDAHQSEYPAAADKRREFISHFTGSAGLAVVSLTEAALATDGRYTNQAGKQLDSNWELMKSGNFSGDETIWRDWLSKRCSNAKSVGVDPTTVTASWARDVDALIKSVSGKGLVPIDTNLVDQVWGHDRPVRPLDKIFVHDIKYAGKSYQEKLAGIRQEIEQKKRAGLVVTALSEIAWLFNLRGSDVDYNPVFYAYALIQPHATTLYVDHNKLPPDVRKHLEGVNVQPYNSIFQHMTTISAMASAATDVKYLVDHSCSWALVRALGGLGAVEQVVSPVAEHQAIKNSTELQGMRDCQIPDGVALIRFLAWLEDELIHKKTKLDEVTAADQLEKYRRQGHLFKGLSFDTIAASGPNAAVIHYKPHPGKCRVIDPHDIFLVDSGGHYLNGTTDTTRTVHFTTPTDMERKAYTLVLKGFIALASFVFIERVSGLQLEPIARQFLWREGLNFNHGTGHGVGHYNSIHESTVNGISARPAYAFAWLKPGNCFSDEPGYYEDGKFGIRIENVMYVREAQTKHNFEGRPYYGFEHVTMVPMCRKLIDQTLLTADEKTWLNDYHAKVAGRTRTLLKDDPRAMKWMERETAPY